MKTRKCPDCNRVTTGRKVEHEPSCPIGRGVEAACDRDSDWFKAHPGERTRDRALTYAERLELVGVHGATIEADAFVRVVTIRPGLRARKFIGVDLGGGR